jgi:hypothetical protein
MKQRFLILAAGIILAFTVFSCRKSTNKEEETEPIIKIPGDTTINRPDSSEVAFPQNALTGCSYAPNYGDTLICAQPTPGQDYIITPVNNPGAGKYMAWPVGMLIDSVTGAINVSKSETGLRYLVGFVKQGTTDTCLSELVIAGASYIDSVYVLSQNQRLAVPYYNADPAITELCATGNCQFDITNQANAQKVKVDKQTGKIDLQQTLNSGAFGLLPLNGDMVETTIYYRVNDGCNTSIQKITVQLMYFNRKSDIGQGLLGNLLSKLTNLLNGNILSTTANPRPPLIIITRYN